MKFYPNDTNSFHKKKFNLDTKTVAKIVRKALKSKCKSLSIRMACGTAYGYIDIWGSGECHDFTEKERKVLTEFGIVPGGNCAHIAWDEYDYIINRICELMPEMKAYIIAHIL